MVKPIFLVGFNEIMTHEQANKSYERLSKMLWDYHVIIYRDGEAKENEPIIKVLNVPDATDASIEEIRLKALQCFKEGDRLMYGGHNLMPPPLPIRIKEATQVTEKLTEQRCVCFYSCTGYCVDMYDGCVKKHLYP